MGNRYVGGGVGKTGSCVSLKSQAKGDWRRERYAAIDLGTNNCRLLIAAPKGRGFRVVDAFSRIVRLGEGLSQTGVLCEAAMDRTLDALKICSEKSGRRGVTRIRCIATQACRGASNGVAFLERVKTETGLSIEIINTEEEARLAVMGSAELLDPTAKAGLIFDIGGGSTEISWVRPNEGRRVEAWSSLTLGVVSLAERWGGKDISAAAYEAMVEEVGEAIRGMGDEAGLRGHFERGEAHLLGTSGTVTSIAGVYLGLKRYRRDLVDGLWLSAADTRMVTERLRTMSFEERVAEPCIGLERADLVVSGCAILEALLREWPSERIRVADRGLREGLLSGLAEEAYRERQQHKRRQRGLDKKRATS